MQETEEKLLDVVEEFVAVNQSEAYQNAYRNWRRRKNNRYAFRFSKNPKEAAFSESKAVVSESPAQAEQSALHSLGTLFGVALLLYLVIENVLDKAAVFAAHQMGMHIESLFWGGNHYFGDDLTVFLFSGAFQMLKLLVPTLVISLALRMPLSVSIPLRVCQKKQLLSSVSLMMLLSVGLGISLVSRSAELEKYRMISNAGSDNHWIVLYMIFTIFVAPFFWVLLFHGSMFQSLRQFGDGFAVAIVTILAAALTHDFNDALRIGLVTLTISYFMVRTGSFLTAVLLRIIHEIYMFSLYQIESYGGMFSTQWWVVVLFPCLMGLVTIILTAIREKDGDAELHANPGYMEVWDKCSALLTPVPMVLLMIVCMLLTVIAAVLG